MGSTILNLAGFALLIAVVSCSQPTYDMGFRIYEWGLAANNPAIFESGGVGTEKASLLLNSRKYDLGLYSRAEGKYRPGLMASTVRSHVGEWPRFFGILGGNLAGSGHLVYERDVTIIEQAIDTRWQGEFPQEPTAQLAVRLDSARVNQLMLNSLKQFPYGAAQEYPQTTGETVRVEGTLAGTMDGEDINVQFAQDWVIFRHDSGVY